MKKSKLATLLLVAITMVASLFLLLQTSLGLHLALNISQLFLKGEVTVSAVRGNIIGPFTIEGLHYQDKKVLVNSKNLEVFWQPMQLFKGKIVVDRLAINDLTINLITAKDQKINLANDIKIDDIKIYNLIVSGVEKWQFNSIIKAGTAMLEAQGKTTPNLDVTWKVKIPNLAELVKDSQGKFFSAGKIQGTLQAPFISVNTQGKDLKLKDWSIATISSDVTIDYMSNGKLAIDLLANNIAWQGYIFSINLNTQGTVADHLVKLNIIQKNYNLAIISQGGFKKQNWQGRMQKLDYDNWHLQKPAPIKLGLDNIELAKLILKNQQQFFYLQGEWQKAADLLIKFKAEKISLANFSQLLPENIQLIGNLNAAANFSYNNEAKTTKIAGIATIVDAKATLHDLGIKLKNINLTAKADKSNIIYTANANSGDGSINIRGNSSFAKDFTTNLIISGNNFKISDTPEFNIAVTPKLQTKIVGNNIEVKGEVLLPFANLNPRDYSKILTLPNDVIFIDHNNKPLEQPSFFTINSSIQLKLGQKVQFNAMGFQGQLRGKLQITSMPKQLTTAVGQLKVARGTGSYSFLKQQLPLRYGALNFTGGDIGNPGIDAKAIRIINTNITAPITNLTANARPQDALSPLATTTALLPTTQQLVVGIMVTGTLNHPHAELFSEPPTLLPTQILSYLVTGQASGANPQLLLQAANMLNIGNSGSQLSNVTEQLRTGLGLNELEVMQTPGSSNVATMNTSLVLGKYLAPRLYLSYSLGILQPINIFKLRYQLGKNWIAQTQSSSLGNGIDLLYTIERN